MLGALGAIAGLGSSGMQLAGSAYATHMQDKQNRRNLTFQREMAQNAHQYEVEDLRKAGLNPILSSGGSGASASGGSNVGYTSPTAGASDAVTSAYKTFNIEKELAKAKINLDKKLGGQADATARNQRAQAKNTENLEPRTNTIGSAWDIVKNTPKRIKKDIKRSKFRPPRSWKQAKENWKSHFK